MHMANRPTLDWCKSDLEVWYSYWKTCTFLEEMFCYFQQHKNSSTVKANRICQCWILCSKGALFASLYTVKTALSIVNWNPGCTVFRPQIPQFWTCIANLCSISYAVHCTVKIHTHTVLVSLYCTQCILQVQHSWYSCCTITLISYSLLLPIF